MSSEKWRPLCLGLNVLIWTVEIYEIFKHYEMLS